MAGIELEATGDFSPQQLSQTGRRELRNILRSHDLELSALSCPLRRGLDVAENQQPRIEHVRDVLSLSYDLGARLVTVFAGKIPEATSDATSAETPPPAPSKLLLGGASLLSGALAGTARASDPERLEEALRDLGRHGDKVGATLALETGAEGAEALDRYLARFDSGSLAACLNPGQLLLARHDPVLAARTLKRRVAYVRGTEARYQGAALRLVPVGQGDIDWLQMLGAFAEIEYRGWLTVEGENRAEAGQAVAFLRRLVAA